MRQIRAIHVDDDLMSINAFVNLVENIPELSLIKSFTNTEDAFNYLQTNTVDILFSDIEMPDKDGFWLAEQTLDSPLDIVFITAHSGYALDAFEACALDYLMKPVKINRLKALVKRIKDKAEIKEMQTQIKEVFNNYIDSNSYPKKIFIQAIGLLHVVVLEEVMYFSASSGYTNVKFASGKVILSSKPLKTYIDALVNHPHFVRTHRSFFVNKHHVKEINLNNGKFLLNLSNGEQIEGASFRKDEITEMLIS